MNRKYWLDLFTGTTWDEFVANGSKVSGFRKRREKMARKIKPGDYLIGYITGIMRFVAVLEVKSECYIDNSEIWKDGDFPCRFKVKPIYSLEPKFGVPILDIRDNLSFFRGLKSPNAWTGFFRGSPAEFKKEDGEAIVASIIQTLKNPIEREFEIKKYTRIPKTYESKLGVVTVPDTESDDLESSQSSEKTTHEEIQYLLLKLGSDLGLDVWVARNDRGRQYKGYQFQNIPKLLNDIPRQFDDATNKTIELIDVLWLQGDAIIAAFEVEHTSAIYSGLLRMADLVSMQPNIKLNLYLVAPDERRDKVFNEINRPTFARLKPPLPQICKFIPYSDLKKEISQIGKRIHFMKPEFIEELAENCEPDEV
jgi:predicted RNA-binding protein